VYRYTLDGKQYREVIGDRRIVTKEHARARAEELGREVRAGALVDRKLTLRKLVEEFLSKSDRPGARTKRDYVEALERDVFPQLGDKPAGVITSAQIAQALSAVESRPPAYRDRKRWRPPAGHRGTNAAHKARCALGSTFRWALKRRLVVMNPCAGLGFIQRPVVRDRKVSGPELASLWIGIESAPNVSRRVELLLFLIILTGQRVTEVAGAKRGELELDCERPRWSIPAERMKRKGRPQVIALSRQAATLFREAAELANDEHIFPPDESRGVRKRLVGHKPRRPHIHGESVSKAMARVCEHAGLEDLHAHDMRKALATWAGDGGIQPHVVDYILHHAAKTTTGAHYDFSTMDLLVRPALQAWADHVEAAAAGSAPVAKL
jgi:integrase